MPSIDDTKKTLGNRGRDIDAAEEAAVAGKDVNAHKWKGTVEDKPKEEKVEVKKPSGIGKWLVDTARGFSK